MKYDFSDIPNDKLLQAIDKWVKGDRNRKILKRRLIDCMTFSELAEEFNICERHIKRIVIDAENRIFSHL